MADRPHPSRIVGTVEYAGRTYVGERVDAYTVEIAGEDGERRLHVIEPPPVFWQLVDGDAWRRVYDPTTDEILRARLAASGTSTDAGTSEPDASPRPGRVAQPARAPSRRMHLAKPGTSRKQRLRIGAIWNVIEEGLQAGWCRLRAGKDGAGPDGWDVVVETDLSRRAFAERVAGAGTAGNPESALRYALKFARFRLVFPGPFPPQ